MARKSASNRPLRVGEALRHSVSELFLRGNLSEPDLYDESLSVTDVVVTPDLRHATFHVAVLGQRSEPEMAALETALMRTAGEVRNHIARTVTLRYVPSVRLVLDRRFDRAEALGDVFNRDAVQRDIAEPGDDATPSDAEDDGHGA